jgi:hypothetical protein
MYYVLSRRAYWLSLSVAFLFFVSFLFPFMLFYTAGIGMLKGVAILLASSIILAGIVADLIIHLVKVEKLPAIIRKAKKLLWYSSPFGWCALAIRGLWRKMPEHWHKKLKYVGNQLSLLAFLILLKIATRIDDWREKKRTHA